MGTGNDVIGCLLLQLLMLLINRSFYLSIFFLVFIDHSCSTALCPDPADIVNGMVALTGNSVGDTATYTCNLNFELIGNASSTCTLIHMNIASFAPAAPVCRREYYVIINRIISCYTTMYFTFNTLYSYFCSPVS